MSVRIRVRLFGAFREWQPAGMVQLELPPDSCMADVKRALVSELSGNGDDSQLAAWVGDSVLADDQSTLLDSDPVGPGRELAILPPVCGG